MKIAPMYSEALMQSGPCIAEEYSQFLEQRQEQIVALAHFHWLMRGCPEGTPEVDWFAAELDFDRQFVAQLELGLPA